MTELDRVADPWEQLERVPPGSLVQARETLHWAAQIPGAAGHSLVPPEPGDGHTALRWDDALRGLATDPGPGFRVALLPEPMALLLLLDEGGPVSRLELDGRTLEDALAWLERAIAEHTGAPPARPLERRDYDLPAHAVATGAPFVAVDPEQRGQLTRWFANGARLLEAVRAEHDGASPVRCWPHHFDIATLITLDADADPETTRTVGIGLSPGDGGTPEPYWYVTPWPYPDADALPLLGGEGHWHTAGWVGAVLPASRLTDGDAAAQARQAVAFVRSAIAAAMRLLGED